MHADGYFALVLTPESVALLTETFASLPNCIAHHCTVRYGTCDPSDLPEVFSETDLGRVFQLEVVGFATRADGGVQAAVVALRLPDGRLISRGFSQNAVPHVTVATDGVTEPVAANALLEGGFDPIRGSMVLQAVLLHTPAPRS